MTAVPPPPPDFVSYEEYCILEAKSEGRHDYDQGQIVAMSGGTSNHSSITVNLTAAFHQSLRGKPCRVFGSDLRG